MHFNHFFRVYQYVICIIGNKEDSIIIPEKLFTARKPLHQFLKFYTFYFKKSEGLSWAKKPQHFKSGNSHKETNKQAPRQPPIPQPHVLRSPLGKATGVRAQGAVGSTLSLWRRFLHQPPSLCGHTSSSASSLSLLEVAAFAPALLWVAILLFFNVSSSLVSLLPWQLSCISACVSPPA